MQERDKPCYLTPDGKARLQHELADLRTIRRPATVAQIHELNEFDGTLEGSELEEAMKEQNTIDVRIRDIEYMLKRAIILDGAGSVDKISLGSQVTVKDAGGEEIRWMIVSSAEASSRNGKISNESLVGSALLGHRVGDQVNVKVPAGVQEFTILKIE